MRFTGPSNVPGEEGKFGFILTDELLPDSVQTDQGQIIFSVGTGLQEYQVRMTRSEAADLIAYLAEELT